MILPPSHVEIIICDHCNIACTLCNHASPAIARWFVTPESVARDLGLLARYYRAPFLKILGGEPLLHPRLGEVLQACRSSAVAPVLRLVTNGLLLHRCAPEVLGLVDVLELSRYPGQEVRAEGLQRIPSGVRLEEAHHPTFRETFAGLGTQDPGLVERVYRACKLAHYWGCHSVREGYFYKCPQSAYVPGLYGCGESRVELRDHPGLPREILDFVNSREPLPSCRHCAGSSGKYVPHQITTRARWRPENERRLEDIVDPGQLD